MSNPFFQGAPKAQESTLHSLTPGRAKADCQAGKCLILDVAGFSTMQGTPFFQQVRNTSKVSSANLVPVHVFGCLKSKPRGWALLRRGETVLAILNVVQGGAKVIALTLPSVTNQISQAILILSYL